MENTLALLRADAGTAAWLTTLESDDSPGVEIVLPDAGTLLDLAVPHQDLNEILATGRKLRADPELWWLLERCAARLARGIGTVDDTFDLPYLPAELGAPGRYFHVYVFAAVLPLVLAYHQARGVPADISRRTFADLGRNIALHRRRHGVGGVLQPFWIKLHFRGELYHLGRLQFQRTLLDERLGRAVAADLPLDPAASALNPPPAPDLPLGPGSPTLNLHIPDFYGPLTREACDDSLTQARAFFPRHFPEETYALATCSSWLLDPQLADHLPAHSNIVDFQQRFHLAHPVDHQNDQAPIQFVFGDPDLPLESLSPASSLEHAVVEHLKAGGHWHIGHGWFPL